MAVVEKGRWNVTRWISKGSGIWLGVAMLLASGCGEGPPAERRDGGEAGITLCRCQAEVAGGALNVPCGESACLGGQGYRCTDDGEVVSNPEACRAGETDGGTDGGDGGRDGGPPPPGGCGPDTCDGCCDGERCLGGTSRTACGAYGEACVDCGPARLCDRDTCVVDPASRWSIILLDGMVDERAPSGETWDGLGGLPDVFAEVRVGNSMASPTRSTTVSDSLSPRWNEVVVDSARADDLMRYVDFDFYDEDVDANDLVGSCTFALIDENFMDGSRFDSTCGAITFTWSLRRE